MLWEIHWYWPGATEENKRTFYVYADDIMAASDMADETLRLGTAFTVRLCDFRSVTDSAYTVLLEPEVNNLRPDVLIAGFFRSISAEDV